jgi:membrane-associated HD superfamily phosphohydrolase
MALQDRIQPGKFFQVVLIAFAVLQFTSWILDELDIFPLIKGGWFLMLLLAIVALTTLFTIGRTRTPLELKRNALFILLVFAIIVGLVIFLPKYIPQIFSASSIEFGEAIKQTMISVIKLTPGGIAS